MDVDSGMKAAIYEQIRREKMLKAPRIVSQLSFSPIPPLVERAENAPQLFPVDVYYLFTLELMPSLHLGIINLLKTVSYSMLAPKPHVLEKQGLAMLAGLL